MSFSKVKHFLNFFRSYFGKNQDVYANCYEIECDGLRILELNTPEHCILHWLTVLLQHREFDVPSALALEAKEYLLANFSVDHESFDVIIGYRADDSYFSFANAFLNNAISLAQLEMAMYLGKLGEQVVLKSRKAFHQIVFSESISAEKEIYYPKKTARDKEARAAYRRERGNRRASDAIYLLDILREEWEKNDPRLRRNLSE